MLYLTDHSLMEEFGGKSKVQQRYSCHFLQGLRNSPQVSSCCSCPHISAKKKKDSLKAFIFPTQKKTFSASDQTHPCHQLAPPCNNQAPFLRDFLPAITGWEILPGTYSPLKPILAFSSSTPPSRCQTMFFIRAESTVGKITLQVFSLAL